MNEQGEQQELVPQPPKLSVCRSCRATIIWVRTERGKKMPLDGDPVDDQTQQNLFVLRDRSSYEGPLAIAAWGLSGTEPHYRSHFATCTHADDHRKLSSQQVTLRGETFEDIFKNEAPQDRMQIG
jgi:hypothetical protein